MAEGRTEAVRCLTQYSCAMQRAACLARRRCAASPPRAHVQGYPNRSFQLPTAPTGTCFCAAGQPIATEEMRYGLRAAVVVLPAHPLLTTPEALAVVGPAAFGHAELAYAPLGRYAEPASISI